MSSQADGLGGDEQVAIPFNRRMLRGLFLFSVILSVMGIPLVVLFASTALLNVPHVSLLWRALSFLMVLVLGFSYGFIMRWAFFLGRCLRRNTPACIFCREGVVDNVSSYWIGLIPWTEMDRIFPYRMTLRLRFAPRVCFRLPRQRRTIGIMLKDPHRFRARLPWWKAWMMLLEPNRRLVGIAEGMLSVTADEFMQRLNGYYVAHVRRDGLP